jgi:hypothetical protein
MDYGEIQSARDWQDWLRSKRLESFRVDYGTASIYDMEIDYDRYDDWEATVTYVVPHPDDRISTAKEDAMNAEAIMDAMDSVKAPGIWFYPKDINYDAADYGTYFVVTWHRTRGKSGSGTSIAQWLD